ncbi:MAG: OmpA family protein, partial [Burkholderiales bacterium]
RQRRPQDDRAGYLSAQQAALARSIDNGRLFESNKRLKVSAGAVEVLRAFEHGRAQVDDLEATQAETESARRDAENALRDAESAHAEADAARAQSEQTSQEAETAREQATQARKLADAQAKEAELARKEARLLEAGGAGRIAKPAAAVAPITLGASVFAPGQSVLRQAAARAQIGKIVAAAGARRSIRIVAYANDGGSAKGDLTLSHQRAAAVRDALIATGIEAQRISARGVGAKGGKSRRVVVSFGQR